MDGAETLFPVAHSLVAPGALAQKIAHDYGLNEPVAGKLISNNSNDTYLITSPEEKYICRIYRAKWRTLEEISFELEMLLYLKERGATVSVPLYRKDGQLWDKLSLPEGERVAVLFSYAPGVEKGQDENVGYIYGQAAAKLHFATEGFKPSYKRFDLDLHHLLREHLELVEAELKERPADWQFLQDSIALLEQKIEALNAAKLDWGLCHGDFHSFNAHFDENNLITLFDFDCGGYGWRAYELAVYWFTLKVRGQDQHDKTWQAFLHGYLEKRPLSPADIEAIPVFVAIRHIWQMKMQVFLSNQVGGAWINSKYFDAKIAFLRSWLGELDARLAVHTSELKIITRKKAD